MENKRNRADKDGSWMSKGLRLSGGVRCRRRKSNCRSPWVCRQDFGHSKFSVCFPPSVALLLLLLLLLLILTAICAPYSYFPNDPVLSPFHS